MEQPNKIDQEATTEGDVNQATEPDHHSDKEMLIHVAVKFLLLFVIILSFDVLLDLMRMLLDLFFEVIHILIEIIDEVLESLLAETLPTTHHQNEVIIVNVALIIVLFSLYKLFHSVRYIYRLKRHLKVDWLIYKRHKIKGWRLLSLLSKIKLVAAYCAGFTFIFLFAF